MLQRLFILFALIGLPSLAGQNLQTTNTTATPGCQVVKSKQHLDAYFVCGKAGHADILQIEFGEGEGQKIHIFIGKESWTQYYHRIEHKNCADFQIAANGKEAQRIQQGLRRNLK